MGRDQRPVALRRATGGRHLPGQPEQVGRADELEAVVQQRQTLKHDPKAERRGQDHQIDPPHHSHQQGQGAAKTLGGAGAGEQHVVGARRAAGNQGKSRQGQ